MLQRPEVEQPGRTSAGGHGEFLAQVERDVTSPSIATVGRIARALDLSLAQLFADDADVGRVVRREARRRVTYAGPTAVGESLTSTHDSDEEVVVVLTCVLDVWVGEEHYVLVEGDAITSSSRLPHWSANHGEDPVTVLICLTPPSF